MRRTRLCEERACLLACVARLGEENPEVVTRPVGEVVTVGTSLYVLVRIFLEPAGVGPFPSNVCLRVLKVPLLVE